MQQPPSLPPLPLPPPTTSSSFLYFSSSPSLPTYLLPSFLLPPPFSLLLPPPAGGQRRGSDPESIGGRSRLRVARCDDPPSALTSRGNRQRNFDHHPRHSSRQSYDRSAVISSPAVPVSLSESGRNPFATRRRSAAAPWRSAFAPTTTFVRRILRGLTAIC